MKKLFVVLSLLGTIVLFAQSRNIAFSEIRWKGYKTLKAESLSHNGTVRLKSGNLIFKNNEITGGNFVMDMTTMDAEDLNDNKKLKTMFENHLKSDDFFDTAKFPESSFQIKSVKKLNNSKYSHQFNGVLTIKGISKNISFPANISQENNQTTIKSATFTFNRKTFGLQYNIFEDMLISKDVEMNVMLRAK